MFHVVEFHESCDGGVAIVRNDWLTPRKKESFWPPYKLPKEYDRCLTSETQDFDKSANWPLFPIWRILYTTGSLPKARSKLREAEDESDLYTDDEVVKKRKIVKNRLFCDSESEENEKGGTSRPTEHLFGLHNSVPQPPAQNLNQSLDSEPQNTPTGNICEPPAPNLHTPIDCSTPRPTSLNSTDAQVSAYGVIAKHLADIYKKLEAIENTQESILCKLFQNENGATFNEPLDIPVPLPCVSTEDVDSLEQWLTEEENLNNLVKHLSFIGGKKVIRGVSKILEKIFSNGVAVHYNWTGKGGKLPLKSLAIVKAIPGIVRLNKNLTNSTDDDINTAVSNWFRFSRDRDGGRDRRRPQHKAVQ